MIEGRDGLDREMSKSSIVIEHEAREALVTTHCPSKAISNYFEVVHLFMELCLFDDCKLLGLF